MRVSVVIPALNEEKNIGRVVEEIPDYVDEIVVVDNGSEDSTTKEAKDAGAKAVYEPRKGYGYACLRGISALDQPEIVVFIDGDCSFYPEDIRLLLEPMQEESFDLVVGSRIERRERDSMPVRSLLANLFFGKLIGLIHGQSFTDLGPFRAISYSKLLALEMREKRYGWTAEM